MIVCQMIPSFIHLNCGWNADPNFPEVRTQVDGEDVLLQFNVNAFQFSDFNEGAKGVLRFVNCSRFRLGATNHEGWYLGQCRFTGLTPQSVIGKVCRVIRPCSPQLTRSALIGFSHRDRPFAMRHHSGSVAAEEPTASCPLAVRALKLSAVEFTQRVLLWQVLNQLVENTACKRGVRSPVITHVASLL
jgi:hypothetical protein